VPGYLEGSEKQHADVSVKRPNKDSEDRYKKRLNLIREEFNKTVDKLIGEDASEGIRKGSRGLQERLCDAIKLFK
jgi:hypothetical protein